MRPSRIPSIDWWTWPADRLALPLATALFLFLWTPAFSISDPYLTSAEISISVDDVADVWLNGIPIVKNQLITMPGKAHGGPYRVDPCVFKPFNLLAVRCSDTNPTSAMVAFLLKMNLSDGTARYFTSRESEKIKCFYIGPPGDPEPPGWWMPGFMDRGWETARSVGAYSTYLTIIDDPDAPGKPLYLTANDNSGKTLVDGERHLFRGFFSLEAGESPSCSSPTPRVMPKTPTPTPSITPTWTRTSTVTPTATPVPPRPTATPRPLRPTATPKPIATATPFPLRPTRTPWIILPTRTPWSIPARTPWVLPTRTPWVIPTATRWIPKPTPTKPPVPTSTPGRPRPRPTAPWKKFEPTPTVRYKGDVMVTGPRHWLPPTATCTPRQAPPKATSTKMAVPPPSDALVFDQVPVDVDLSLADGPGNYTVDLLTEDGRFLSRIFDQKVAGNLEAWVEWDGTVEGRRAPSGTYLFVCRKGDRELKRIWVVLKTKP